MPKLGCNARVKKVTKGGLSDEEIQGVLDRLAQRQREKMGSTPSLDELGAMRAAAAELARSDVIEAAISTRTRLAAARAKGYRAQLMGRMPGGDSDAEKLRSLLVGSDKFGPAYGLSVDSLGRALEQDRWGDVDRGLKAAGLDGRIGNWAGAIDTKLEEDVVDEMARLNGLKSVEPTGNADAEKIATIFNAATEKNRVGQNLEGAWIGKLEGYVARQSHDATRVAGGFWREIAELRANPGAGLGAARAAALEHGFQRWRDFIVQRLDDRTFEGVDALAPHLKHGPLSPGKDARETFLKAVWWDIVTGRHAILKGAEDGSDYVAPPSKARAVSAQRVLHFKSPRDWLDYHRAYGSGQRTLYSAVISDLSRGARNTALMRTFGPAPEAAFKAQQADLLRVARDRNDAIEGKRLGGGRVTHAFEAMTGMMGADNVRLARIGNAIRGQQSLAKLGAMVFTAFNQLPIASQALARAGVSFLDGYGGVLRGLAARGDAEAREVASLVDVYARAHIGHLAARFNPADGALGWMSQGMSLFHKVNGFEWWIGGVRAGMAHTLAAHLGSEAEHGWDALRLGTRETLERYGLGPREWELIRHGAAALPDAEPGGRKYLTFDAVDGLADKDLHAYAGLKGAHASADGASRIREDLRSRLMALVGDVLDSGAHEPGARERLAVTFATRPGTVMGEVTRLVTQFLIFPRTFLGRTLGPAARGFAGRKPVATLSHLIVATTLMGYLARQAKLIASGHQPDSLIDADGHPNTAALTAAMVQGGGLGIYGDFLFGEYNRFGGSPWASLGGPTVGTAEQMFRLFGKIQSGEDPIPSGIMLARSNLPFVNVWYTKLALDYLIFWRLNEALSPGWAARHERTVDDETGSRFWLRPSEAVH